MAYEKTKDGIDAFIGFQILVTFGLLVALIWTQSNLILKILASNIILTILLNLVSKSLEEDKQIEK